MSDYDQHGNHFPDHNHLQHFPSDAYGDDVPPSGRLPLNGVRIAAGLGTAFICAVLIALNYIRVLDEMVPKGSPECTYDSRGQLNSEPCRKTPQSAAQERTIQAETRARMARILEELRQRQKGQTR